MFGKISERNFHLKDKKIREMLLKLPIVKPNIQKAVLRKYLR